MQCINQNNSNPPKKSEISKDIFSRNNSNKKKKKRKKGLNIFSRLGTNNISSSKKVVIEENGIKIELNEQQIYEMFLLTSKYIDSELNILPYKKVIKLDKRNYCDYYSSLIRTKHILFFSFFPLFDYNSRTLKIFLFFFNFTVNFIVNALFFNDATMHKIYTDGGSFNFIYNIPQILYSSFIAGFINAIIKILALSDTNFIELRRHSDKNNINQKVKEVINTLKIKFILFFMVNFALLILFWFYLACFCAVYKNTQLHLIKDTLISFGASMLYPFGIYLFPGIFRINSIKRKKRETMYNLSKLLQML